MADQPQPQVTAPSTDVPVEGIIQPGQSLIEGRNTVDPYQPTDLFLEQKVRNFRNTDFALDSMIPIALRHKDCILVLFYNDMNRNDRDAAIIWQDVARLGSIASFAAVNLRTETAVGEAINQIKSNPNSPVYDYAPKGIPAIIVYRDQVPQSFYNGPYEVQAIIDFTLSLACDANYHEREQRRFGADTNSLQIPGGQVIRQPRSSTDLLLGQGLRQYGRDYGRTTIEQLEQNAVPVSGTTGTFTGGPTVPGVPGTTATGTGATGTGAVGTEEEAASPGASNSEAEEGGI